MKFPIKKGEIATIYVDQRAARECYMTSLKIVQKPRLLRRKEDERNVIAMVNLDSRMHDEEMMEPKEETTLIELGENEKQCTYVGGSMPEELMNELVKILRRNNDLFAWKVTYIPSINPNVISNKLSLCQEVKSIS